MITRQVFEAQCKRRFGNANPERQRFEHWERMVRTGSDPYLVRTDLGLEPNSRCVEGVCGDADPDWCFKRFGMSRTRMADGRVICIAGEHEDWYDPDFCIYNDVIVLRPGEGEKAVTENSGEVDIYGYPEAAFAPSDFHSVTLVGEHVYVVGRLGYQQARLIGTTPVYALDTRTYGMEPVATKGPCPGWVHDHHASYDAARHALIVRGGKVVRALCEAASESRAVHRLNLADGVWEKLAEAERFRRYVIERVGNGGDDPEWTAEDFRPSRIAHVWLGWDEERSASQIEVNGVRVSFRDRVLEVRVDVEGEVSEEALLHMLEDVKAKLAGKSGAEWAVREVEVSD